MADGDVTLGPDVPTWLARLVPPAPPARSVQPWQGPDDAGPAAPRLGSMTKPQLLAEAERRGIEVDRTATKAVILAAIEAAIREAPSAGQPAAAGAAPDCRSFVGYFGGEVERGNRQWVRLYLDLDGQNWLIIENDGVVQREPVLNEAGVAPGRMVLWVRPDAVVGRGKRSLSIEGEFLAGAFTRAGDFDLGAAGGTPAAATGVFCDARSVGCCMGRTKGPPG